jgi:two-component system sensor histidine kinase/response regulator
MTEAKPSILLVDDVPANLVALQALLGDLACDLVQASDGNEALRQLLKREFAVMLLDVQMPDMDGYEVATFARSNPRTRDVPIIFLTAMHDSEASMLRGYGSGAVDFLLKPFNAHVLRAKVKVFLELYNSRRLIADEVRAHEQTLIALQHANAALRHFTDAASHDLQAPLRAIRGFLRALTEDGAAPLEGTVADYVTRSLRAAERMDSLLASLLDYARLQRTLNLGDVDCAAVLKQVEADLGPRISASSAVLSVGPLPSVRGDKNRLYQLFLNLVSNALKFQKAGHAPHVAVRAERRPNEILFCVEDDGIGIAPQHLATVFGAFKRLHAASSYEGSGLGLAICQQIVEQHGGRIWVESELGSGSRFQFALPAR